MNGNLAADHSSSSTNGIIASLKKNCDEIANMPSNDVQQIASVLQKMIVSYYQDVRRQALLAFSAALALEVVAVIFFVYAASLAMNGNDQKKATLCAVAGLLIQVMTGIVFFLYSQSAKQFGGFHICLERTNRFLLANAMVERLPDSEQVPKRAEVITAVLNTPMLTMSIIEGGT